MIMIATEFPNEIIYLDDFIKWRENGIDTIDRFMDILNEVYDEFTAYYCLDS